MMNKNFRLLAAVVLAVCLVSFVFDRFVPARTVYAANEANAALNSTGAPEKEAVSFSLSTQPIVFVVTGLVCALFGIIAVSPLLIDGSGAVIARDHPGREDQLDMER